VGIWYSVWSRKSNASMVSACRGEEFSTENDPEAGHAQDDFGVAVAAKSLLDHRLGVGDFGVEGDHLLCQPGHHGRG
jgi:hypothetical protein